MFVKFMNSYGSKKNTRSQSESLDSRPDSVTISLYDSECTNIPFWVLICKIWWLDLMISVPQSGFKIASR